MGYIRLRLPPPRTYESLRATFRRPQELVTTETVDIAAAAAAAAEAEDDGKKEEKTRNLKGVMEDGHPNGTSGSNRAVGVGGYVPAVSSSGMAKSGNTGVNSNGYNNHSEQAKNMEADKLMEAGEESANEDDQQNDEFVPDVHMRRGETACRKLCVEGASPLLKVSRVSPATSEALGGEETEEVR